MATIAAGADRKSAERKFYSRMAILLVAVVFIGFAPSFYLKGIVPPYPRPNPTLPPAVLFHGLMFTLWMALLIIQTQLISTRRTRVHMKLGKAAMLLAIALVPVMYLTAVWAGSRARATRPSPMRSIGPRSRSRSSPLLPSWSMRPGGAAREAQWHKRLMLGASILFVAGPGFSRIPLAPPTFWAFTIQLLAGIVLLFTPLFVWDRRTNGKIHPATWTGFTIGLAVAIIPLTLIYTNSWAAIAAKLPGVAV